MAGETGEISSIGVKLTLEAGDFMAGLGNAENRMSALQEQAKQAGSGAGQTAGGGSSARSSAAQGSTNVSVNLTVSKAAIKELRTQITSGLGAIPVQIDPVISKEGMSQIKTMLGSVVADMYGTSQQTAEGRVSRSVSKGPQRREYGGPVTSGQSYIVGEKRPEVFVPRTSGTVFPNADQYRRRELDNARREHQRWSDHQRSINSYMHRMSGGPVERIPRGTPATLVPGASRDWPGLPSLQRPLEPRERTPRGFGAAVARPDWIRRFLEGRGSGGPVEPQGPLQRRIAGLPPLEAPRPVAPAPQPSQPEWMRRAQERRLPPKVYRMSGGPSESRGPHRSPEFWDRMFGDKPGMWWDQQNHAYRYAHERPTQQEYEDRQRQEADQAHRSRYAGMYEEDPAAFRARTQRPSPVLPPRADSSSLDDKLIRMAGQTRQSPNEAAIARRKLRERGVPGYMAGGRVRQSQSLEARAFRMFGETDEIMEAGYISPSGRMLDFSGRHEASGYRRQGDRFVPTSRRNPDDYLSHQRNIDHRQAWPLFEGRGQSLSGPQSMERMLQRGWARVFSVDPESNEFMGSIGRPLTTAQRRTIMDGMWDEDRATGIFDVHDRDGDIKGSVGGDWKLGFDQRPVRLGRAMSIASEIAAEPGFKGRKYGGAKRRILGGPAGRIKDMFAGRRGRGFTDMGPGSTSPHKWSGVRAGPAYREAFGTPNAEGMWGWASPRPEWGSNESLDESRAFRDWMKQHYDAGPKYGEPGYAEAAREKHDYNMGFYDDYGERAQEWGEDQAASAYQGHVEWEAREAAWKTEREERDARWKAEDEARARDREQSERDRAQYSPGRGDTRSRVDKLKAMAGQTTQSPNEAAIARSRLHDMGVSGYMRGGRAMAGRLDVSGIEPNFRRFFEAANPEQFTEGAHWYQAWGKELRDNAGRLGIAPEILTSVAAQLSPRNSWPGNFHDAIKYAEAWQQGLPMPKASTFGTNQKKAWKLLQDEMAGVVGPKIGPFDAALLGDTRARPQDLWMKRAAVNDLTLPGNKGTPSPGQREEMDRAVDSLAGEYGMDPRQVQAIIWTVAREQGMAQRGAGKHSRMRAGGGHVLESFKEMSPYIAHSKQPGMSWFDDIMGQAPFLIQKILAKKLGRHAQTGLIDVEGIRPNLLGMVEDTILGMLDEFPALASTLSQVKVTDVARYAKYDKTKKTIELASRDFGSDSYFSSSINREGVVTDPDITKQFRPGTANASAIARHEGMHALAEAMRTAGQAYGVSALPGGNFHTLMTQLGTAGDVGDISPYSLSARERNIREFHITPDEMSRFAPLLGEEAWAELASMMRTPGARLAGSSLSTPGVSLAGVPMRYIRQAEELLRLMAPRRMAGGPTRARGDWGITRAGYAYTGNRHHDLYGSMRARPAVDVVGDPIAKLPGMVEAMFDEQGPEGRAGALWDAVLSGRVPGGLQGLAWENMPREPKPHAQGGPGDLDGLYIVGEVGPELFVPDRLKHLVPQKVLSQIPRAKDGIQVIGQKPYSLFAPEENGTIIPNRLMHLVPHAMAGTQTWMGPGHINENEYGTRTPTYGKAEVMGKEGMIKGSVQGEPVGIYKPSGIKAGSAKGPLGDTPPPGWFVAGSPEEQAHLAAMIADVAERAPAQEQVPAEPVAESPVAAVAAAIEKIAAGPPPRGRGRPKKISTFTSGDPAVDAVAIALRDSYLNDPENEDQDGYGQLGRMREMMERGVGPFQPMGVAEHRQVEAQETHLTEVARHALSGKKIKKGTMAHQYAQATGVDPENPGLPIDVVRRLQANPEAMKAVVGVKPSDMSAQMDADDAAMEAQIEETVKRLDAEARAPQQAKRDRNEMYTATSGDEAVDARAKELLGNLMARPEHSGKKRADKSDLQKSVEAGRGPLSPATDAQRKRNWGTLEQRIFDQARKSLAGEEIAPEYQAPSAPVATASLESWPTDEEKANARDVFSAGRPGGGTPPPIEPPVAMAGPAPEEEPKESEWTRNRKAAEAAVAAPVLHAVTNEDYQAQREEAGLAGAGIKGDTRKGKSADAYIAGDGGGGGGEGGIRVFVTNWPASLTTGGGGRGGGGGGTGGGGRAGTTADRAPENEEAAGDEEVVEEAAEESGLAGSKDGSIKWVDQSRGRRGMAVRRKNFNAKDVGTVAPLGRVLSFEPDVYAEGVSTEEGIANRDPARTEAARARQIDLYLTSRMTADERAAEAEKKASEKKIEAAATQASEAIYYNTPGSSTHRDPATPWMRGPLRSEAFPHEVTGVRARPGGTPRTEGDFEPGINLEHSYQQRRRQDLADIEARAEVDRPAREARNAARAAARAAAAGAAAPAAAPAANPDQWVPMGPYEIQQRYAGSLAGMNPHQAYASMNMPGSFGSPIASGMRPRPGFEHLLPRTPLGQSYADFGAAKASYERKYDNEYAMDPALAKIRLGKVGYTSMMTERTPRGTAAVLGAISPFGGGISFKQRQELARQAQMQYGSLNAVYNNQRTDARAKTIALKEMRKQEQASPGSVTADEFALAESERRSTVLLARRTGQKRGAARERMIEVDKYASPKPMDIARSFGSIIASTTAYGVAMSAVAMLIQKAALPALEAMGDAILGWQVTSTRVTSGLAEQTTAAHGNVEAVMAQTAATAGLSKEMMNFISKAIVPSVVAKSAQTAVATEGGLIRAASYNMQGSGAPQGLYGGYGGILGSSILASEMGGNKGFAETVGATFEELGKSLDYARNKQKIPSGNLIPGMMGPGGGGSSSGNLIPGMMGPGGGGSSSVSLPGMMGPGGGGSSSVSLPGMMGPGSQPRNEAELDANAAAAEDLLVAYGKDLEAAFGREAEATYRVGGAFKVKSNATQEEKEAFKRAADMTGDPAASAAAQQMIDQGYVFTDALGNIAKNVKEFDEQWSALAKGKTIADVGTWASGFRRQMEGQMQSLAIQAERTMSLSIPWSMAQQTIQNPLIQPGIGFFGTNEQGQVGAPQIARAGVTGQAANLSSQWLGEASGFQSQIRSISKQGFLGQVKDIQANNPGIGGFKDVIDFTSLYIQANKASESIADTTTALSRLQQKASEKNWDNQIRLATRALGDALGMQGKIASADGKVHATRLGRLEREQYLNQRASSRLGLQLQQREITTQLALAQFQAPGETGEERYFRQKEAIVKAGIGQQQLDFSWKDFKISGEIWKENVDRAATDAKKSLEIMGLSRNVEGASIAAQAKVAEAQKLLGATVGKMDAIVAKSGGSFNTALSAAAGGVSDFTGSVKTAIKEIYSSVGLKYDSKTGRITGGGLPSVGNAQPTYPSPAGEGWVWDQNQGKWIKQRNASGYLGKVGSSGPYLGAFARGALMTVGEAGPETVAILRNPRAAKIGGDGGGPTSVTVNINGASVRSEDDISSLARRVASEVERSLSRKGQMFGLRGPSV